LKTKSATTEISKKFEDLTYLSQLKALRTLGLMILKNYPIALQSLEFIHHGENTTYKVTARNHKKYLLRLHRNDYHSDAAIHEELNWLKALANSTDLNIPNPVQSKNGIYLEKQATDLMIRRGCVFEWTDGQFFEKSIRPKHFHRLGEIISELHKSTKKRKTIRRYWDTNGLIGKNPTFGSLSGLPFVSKRQQQIIDHASTTLQKILNKYGCMKGVNLIILMQPQENLKTPTKINFKNIHDFLISNKNRVSFDSIHLNFNQNNQEIWLTEIYPSFKTRQKKLKFQSEEYRAMQKEYKEQI
jgi:hypothetical protein